MMYFKRYNGDLSGAAKPGALFSALTLSLLLSGCSAEVGRFNNPSFNLSGGTETGALPSPSEPMMGSSAPLGDSSNSYAGNSYTPPPSYERSNGVRAAALPPPSAPPAATPRYETNRGYETRSADAAPVYQPPRARYNPEPRPAPSMQATSSRGDSVTVERGDTLYGIARRNGVTVNALMAANGLNSANIRPGQTLLLPGGASNVAAPLESAPPRTRTAARIPEASPVADAGDWGGTYEVQRGDSLYKIARSHDIRVAELQSANSIDNPRQLKPGMVLRVPGSGSGSGAGNTVAAATPDVRTPSSPAAPPRMIQSTTQPMVINSERRVASLNAGSMTDAVAPSRHETAKPVRTVSITPGNVAVGKLRRPASGKLISGFGQRPDGTHNDGINIAAPQGADIHAVTDGEVVYAGSELKGYGNLILLRHDNGWVTAYAHADRLVVRRGDKVRRGDVIAKVGNTGQVDAPQLHFELRQGSKPVDPLPYLDRL